MNGSPNSKKENPRRQVGWRMDPWREEFGGVSRAQVFEWIKTGELPSVKVGGMRLILISPEDFIAKYTDKTKVA